jgi:hypothetical protein
MKPNPCKSCDDDCSHCAIYLSQNGVEMGYGNTDGYDNRPHNEDAMLDYHYEDRSYIEPDQDD